MADGFFSSTDLLLYVQYLIKESSVMERRTKDNYGWLKSKHDTEDFAVLEKFENITLKLSSESCVTIAIKLDKLIEEARMKPREIRKAFQKLLEEEQNSQLLKDVKKKTNKIHPKVLPEGRRKIVSFISENDYPFALSKNLKGKNIITLYANFNTMFQANECIRNWLTYPVINHEATYGNLQSA